MNTILKTVIQFDYTYKLKYYSKVEGQCINGLSRVLHENEGALGKGTEHSNLYHKSDITTNIHTGT